MYVPYRSRCHYVGICFTQTVQDAHDSAEHPMDSGPQEPSAVSRSAPCVDWTNRETNPGCARGSTSAAFIFSDGREGGKESINSRGRAPYLVPVQDTYSYVVRKRAMRKAG